METATPLPEDNTVNQPKWLILLRVLLGFIILWKGFTFFKDSVAVESLLKGGGVKMFSNNSQTIAFFITYFNLLGGFFIIIGLFTRWMCLIQIPIMIGAVFFVYTKVGMSFTDIELILTVIVLILLIVFAIKGSGTISLDEYFRSYTKAGLEPGHTKKFFQ
jgi:putative oxidoreductase